MAIYNVLTFSFDAANSDYIPLSEEFVFTQMGPSSSCVTLQTLRDNAVEDPEALGFMLVNASGVMPIEPSLFLIILPADDSM